MKYFFLILVFFWTYLFCGLKETTEEFIKKNTSSKQINFMGKFFLPKIIKKKIEKKLKSKFFTDHFFIWKVINKNKPNYVILDHVLGKVKPITYVIFLDSLGKVKATKVIKYRESYGGEVRSSSWLSQFKNRDKDSKFKVGKDIDGISGATISVKSLTKGISRIVNIYPFILKLLEDKYVFTKK